MEIEYAFSCPYCFQTVTMLLDLSVAGQSYVEDCECAVALSKSPTRLTAKRSRSSPRSRWTHNLIAKQMKFCLDPQHSAGWIRTELLQLMADADRRLFGATSGLSPRPPTKSWTTTPP
jgi:hypothetical protein